MASKLAGISNLPAYVRYADDEQSMACSLIENIQREDLNPLEIALHINDCSKSLVIHNLR